MRENSGQGCRKRRKVAALLRDVPAAGRLLFRETRAVSSPRFFFLETPRPIFPGTPANGRRQKPRAAPDRAFGRRLLSRPAACMGGSYPAACITPFRRPAVGRSRPKGTLQQLQSQECPVPRFTSGKASLVGAAEPPVTISVLFGLHSRQRQGCETKHVACRVPLGGVIGRWGCPAGAYCIVGLSGGYGILCVVNLCRVDSGPLVQGVEDTKDTKDTERRGGMPSVRPVRARVDGTEGFKPGRGMDCQPDPGNLHSHERHQADRRRSKAIDQRPSCPPRISSEAQDEEEFSVQHDTCMSASF